MANDGNPSELTTRQQKAIAALLTSRDAKAAAAAAHIGYRTLCRWLTEPAFKAALMQSEGEAIDTATRRLLGLQDAAIDTFDTILTDEKAALAIKLRAAQAILDYLLRLRELRNIEQRLVELEKAVYHDNKHR